MHIESPHAPFVREANNAYCNDQKCVVWGENEVGKNAYSFEDYQTGYVKQLQGLNKKVLELLTTISQKDPNGIVILQGDHGTFMTENLKAQQSFMFAVKNAKALRELKELIDGVEYPEPVLEYTTPKYDK